MFDGEQTGARWVAAKCFADYFFLNDNSSEEERDDVSRESTSASRFSKFHDIRSAAVSGGGGIVFLSREYIRNVWYYIE